MTRRTGPARGRIAAAPAFTMIEMLAVVTLAALAAAVGASMLSGASSSGRVRSTIAAVQRADALARDLALRDGPVLVSAPEGGEVWLRRGVEARPLAVVAVAMPVVLSPAPAVRVDARGRSLDYAVAVASGAALVRFAGLTGWAEVVVAPAEAGARAAGGRP